MALFPILVTVAISVSISGTLGCEDKFPFCQANAELCTSQIALADGTYQTWFEKNCPMTCDTCEPHDRKYYCGLNRERLQNLG